jgi:hypothetical protein
MNIDNILLLDVSSYSWSTFFFPNFKELSFSKNRRHHVSHINQTVMNEFIEFVSEKLGINEHFRQKNFECILTDNKRFFSVSIQAHSDFFCLLDLNFKIQKISKKNPFYEIVEQYTQILKEKENFEIILSNKNKKKGQKL